MSELNIATIPPSPRTRRIAELEAVRADLRAHPIDVEAFSLELQAVERELLELLHDNPEEMV
jgi:hypothetical protein